jgi:hypothetical protein
MREDSQRVIEAVSAWEDVPAQPHRFGGVEFMLGKVEIGHIHVSSGLVDIPFTRRTREALVSTGDAELHHVLPESGWISYWMQNAADVDHAVKLYRLSYLHKRYRRDPNARQPELAGLDFSPAVLSSLTHEAGEAETE